MVMMMTILTAVWQWAKRRRSVSASLRLRDRLQRGSQRASLRVLWIFPLFSTRCIQSSKKLQINEGRTCECSLLQSEFVKFYLFFGFWQLEPWFGQIRPQQQVIFFVQKYQSDSELWLSLKIDIIFASVFVEVLPELAILLSEPSLFLYVVLPGRWWWISFLGEVSLSTCPLVSA